MPIEADSSPETDGMPELPDWLRDDDERTTQATAEPDGASDPSQESDQPETEFQAAQRRDNAGRFTRSEESPTGFVPQDAQAQAAAKSAQDTDTATEQAADDTEPFTYRADGRDYQIPGLRVPEAHADQVRQLLSEGMHHRTTWQQERATAAQEKEEVVQWVQSKQAMFTSAYEILKDLFTNPDKLAEAYGDWQTRGPALLEKARAASLEAELQGYRNQGSANLAQQAAEATESGLWDSMSELIDTQFPNIFDQYDMTDMFAELRQEGIVQVADRDYPELGAQAGDVLLDENALYGRMARKASEIVRQNRAAKMAADKVAKVANQNAATLGRARRPPATIGARAGNVPAAQPGTITNAKDWQRALDSDDD